MSSLRILYNLHLLKFNFQGEKKHLIFALKLSRSLQNKCTILSRRVEISLPISHISATAIFLPRCDCC